MDNEAFTPKIKNGEIAELQHVPMFEPCWKKCHQAGVPFTLLPDDLLVQETKKKQKKQKSEYDRDLMCANNLDMNETTVSGSASQHGSWWLMVGLRQLFSPASGQVL